MQATMNSNALAPTLRLQFARRNYMVRSEKRRRPSTGGSAGQGSGRPPRKRRPQAGIFYKIFMFLLLLTLWPFGLIMLWKRRLRWSGLVKAFTTVVSLMACILLIGFALTVDAGETRYAEIQNRVNNTMDAAADSLVDFSVMLGQRAEKSLEALNELTYFYRTDGLNALADSIDQGVETAQNLKADIIALFGGEESTEAPNITAAPDEADDATKAPLERTAAPEDNAGDPNPTDLSELEEPADDTIVPAATSVPITEITVGDDSDALPVYIPDAAPEAEAGTQLVSGMLYREGTLDAGALPTPAPTPEPTPEAQNFALKPAGEAIVYFNIGSGKYYHMTNVCGSMKNADTHTFAETASNIHQPCERCTPPAKALLEETYIVWMDEENVAHLTDACEAFQGQWNIISAAAANEAGHAGCETCGADRYLAALRDGLTVTLNAAPEAAPAEKTAAEEPSEEENAA